MTPLGSVERFAYSGSLLVRARFAPREGSAVMDRLGRRLGSVRRVFGPIRAPFVSVAVEGKPPLSITGTEVFVEEVRPENREQRREREREQPRGRSRGHSRGEGRGGGRYSPRGQHRGGGRGRSYGGKSGTRNSGFYRNRRRKG